MAIFRENIICLDNLLVVKKERFKYNDFPFHSHPEYEIILILESCGQRIVGDSITDFSAVDLCMFGTNLPHTFYTKGLSDKEVVSQIVIQFHEDFLGMGFFDKKPFCKIRDLFQRSSRGICFTGETREELTRRMISLPAKDNTGSIIEVLHILHLLSLSEDYFLLASSGFMANTGADGSSRMGQIYDFILQNFRRDLALDEVASIACLSPSAFCRYFKKFTRKTFSGFLIDLRIGHACKLLQNNTMGVSQISVESGFNNISYFNRKFKAIKGRTPMEYQKHFATY